MVQLVKNPSVVQETWVQSLGWEDPLEKGKATHSSILVWRISWTEQTMAGPSWVEYFYILEKKCSKKETFIKCFERLKVRVAQSCPTLGDPKDDTVHEILQVRILAWVAVPFSRESSQPRD